MFTVSDTHTPSVESHSHCKWDAYLCDCKLYKTTRVGQDKLLGKQFSDGAFAFIGVEFGVN